MIKSEFRIVFTRPLFWMLAAGLFLVNCFQLVYIETRPSFRYTPQEYRELWSQVSEQYESAVQGKTADTAMMQGSLQSKTENAVWEQLYQQLAAEGQALLQAGDYIQYQLYSQVAGEIDSALHYPDYVESIRTAADNIASFSIFGDENSFSVRVNKKTVAAYEPMRAVTTQPSPSRGIELFSTTLVTDVLLVFFVCFLALLLWQKEREEGVRALSFCTPNGRKHRAGVKLVVMAAITAGMTVFLYASNLLFSGALYGLGDLQRSLPSVQKFSQTTWNITVAEYLLLFLLLKIAAMLFLGFLLSLFCSKLRNTQAVFGCAAVAAAAGFLCYQLIPLASPLMIFKFLNLYGMLRVENCFLQYTNLNCFGYPLYWNLVLYLLLALGGLVLVVWNIAAYAKVDGRAAAVRRKPDRQRSAGRRQKQDNRKPVREKEGAIAAAAHMYTVKLFLHELYKALISKYAFLLILLFLAVQLLLLDTTPYRLYSSEEYTYFGYMNYLQGDVTPEKEQFLREEGERLQQLTERRKESMLSGEPFLLSETDELAIRVFPRVQERYTYLLEHEGAQFLYDTGYQQLLGGFRGRNDIIAAVKMLLMLILCTVGAFVMEPELGAGKLCRATKHGRRRQPVYQALTAFLICITLQLLTYGMELYRVFQVYELDRGTLSFAAASIPELAGFETTMTLSGYLLLVNVVRLVGYLIALYLLYRLSHRLASMSAAITVAAVVLLVPLIIQYLTDGIPLVSAIYSLVLGNEFLI